MLSIIRFFLLLTSLILGAQAWASEVFEYNRPLKALGMGGAYIFHVDPEDAPLVNPAALGFNSKISWDILDVGGGINGMDAYNSSKTLSSITSSSDYTPYFGKRIWIGAYGRTSVVTPNFGIAMFGDLQSYFSLHTPAYPSFEVSLLNDYGFDLAGATMLSQSVSLGYGVKRIYRVGGTQDVGLGVISSGSTSTIISNFKNAGVGYGIDGALEAKLPGPFNPTLAIVWQDIGDTRFTQTGGTEAPPPLENNLAIGLGGDVDLPGLDISAGMEYRHAMNSAYSFGQKLHFGTEIGLPLVDLRAGLSQGYPTYGLGFSFLFMDFDAAYYFTELGAYPGQTPENRIQLGLSISLSIDADFKFTGKDGKRRKLKQRR